MQPRRPIFLAWLNLKRDLGRLVWFCLGIAFAVVLMFVQDGSRNALFDSSVLLLERLRGDLFIVSRQQTTIILRYTFPREILSRAQAYPAVQAVYPVYLEYTRSLFRNAALRLEDRDQAQTIRVIGIDPDAYLLDFPVLDPDRPDSLVPQLRLPGRALFDRLAKTNGDGTVYGPVGVGTETDLAGQRVKIIGEFGLGSDFGTDGTLLVSYETFRRFLRMGPPLHGMEQIDIGLLRVAPGVPLEPLRDELQQFLGPEVDVLTKKQLMRREQRFWQQNTPIGEVFGFGMMMGFVVGVVICLQILSTDIRDNLPAYATLRAIGYPRRFLVRVVLEEALLLAVLGFLPGWLLSWAAFRGLAYLTDLPMTMTFSRIGMIFALTVGMCVVSGLIASVQALEADPAEVF